MSFSLTGDAVCVKESGNKILATRFGYAAAECHDNCSFAERTENGNLIISRLRR